MRKLFLAAGLLAALCGPVLAAPTLKFEARGTNPDGSRYSGTATITIISNTTCTIVWEVGSTASGICMREGSTFAASYVLGSAVGIVIYTIRDDGILDGKWTIAGKDGIGTELLLPIQ
jgi:hypothetical protein